MKERKTSANLQVALRGFCDDWKIELERVRLVITDGGANIKAAVKAVFGPMKHLTCISHTVNNIGQKVIGNTAPPPPSEVELTQVPVDPEEEQEQERTEEEIDMEELNAAPGSIREVLVKVKKIVRFFRQSEVATAKLTELQMSEQGLKEGQCLKLIQEVKTRWNSCYDMLERFV